MNDFENYSRFVEGVFGKGTVKIKNTSKTNNVIGALNDQNNYQYFHNNFKQRLERLKAKYKHDEIAIEEILKQVRLIADTNNWQGAYAELAAFDIMNASPLLITPADLNVDIDADESFANEVGKSTANLDGYFKDYNIYFDIKSLKDNVSEILISIVEEVKRYYGLKTLYYLKERDLSEHYNDIENKRSVIVEEVKNKIWEDIQDTVDKFSEKYGLTISQDNFKNEIYNLVHQQRLELLTEISKLKRTNFKSNTVNSFSLKLIWSPGIWSGESYYSPYKHAEKSHIQIFSYANKVLKNKPTLIIFVQFPWYNNIINDFANSNITFYRSYARRVFCQYKHDERLLKNINSNFNGDQTINEISNCISGIVFLEDDLLNSSESDSINIKPHIYLNPNARNPVSDSTIDYLKSLLYINDFHDYDDFRYDNY